MYNTLYCYSENFPYHIAGIIKDIQGDIKGPKLGNNSIYSYLAITEESARSIFHQNPLIELLGYFLLRD